MRIDRRNFMHAAVGSAIAATLPSASLARNGLRPGIRALAFDAFPIFDPRPIAALAESIYPQQGTALMSAWRVRQFEYQWLRALARRHVDFLQATRDSLAFAIRQLGLDASPQKQQALMAGWSDLRVWPDAADAIAKLRDAGLKLAFLSNMTEAMLADGAASAGLTTSFDAIISTDRVQSFKPDPRAYQLGVDVLGLAKEEILFVAFAGWDVAGAKWFGYPTFWVNRTQAQEETLGVSADGAGSDLAALLDFVLPGVAHR
jgi:2-haloacid dehalogenase